MEFKRGIKKTETVIALATLLVAIAAWQFPVDDDQVALPPNDNSLHDMSGTWEFDYEIWQTVDSTGTTKPASETRNRIIAFEVIGDRLIGRVIGSETQICTDLEINGHVQGSKINLSMEYPGSCCSGSKTSFDGELSSQTSIIGKHFPADRPPVVGCRLWWANVTASKLN